MYTVMPVWKVKNKRNALGGILVSGDSVEEVIRKGECINAC